MRKRVIDQLAVIKPAEFRDATFDCSIRNGEAGA
jgi:hypothetical protein